MTWVPEFGRAPFRRGGAARRSKPNRPDPRLRSAVKGSPPVEGGAGDKSFAASVVSTASSHASSS
eukprot:8505283-Lingulodinium_polyedra.AAC.1